MDFIATFKDPRVAISALQKLLDQRLRLDQVTLMSGSSLQQISEREPLLPLDIEGFGCVWGLGQLALSIAAVAGISGDGRIAVDRADLLSALGLSRKQAERCALILKTYGAVLAVSTRAGLSAPEGLELMLMEYGAFDVQELALG
ncbi:hypothetical protein ABS71_10235 [bacterium SCN 62-11]|nr:hypothetical protein [Candidatus Eremiobacteraeota bacterium]ODT67898.1 MAG: hypothetical protein ABS71_10235 [bacterium SCN 62-11]